jgi:hypothetical protein
MLHSNEESHSTSGPELEPEPELGQPETEVEKVSVKHRKADGKVEAGL